MWRIDWREVEVLDNEILIKVKYSSFEIKFSLLID